MTPTSCPAMVTLESEAIQAQSAGAMPKLEESYVQAVDPVVRGNRHR